MRNEDRKAVVAAYKERKRAAGIFAVRCTPTGECWVGRAPDLRTIGNRIWFDLSMGSSPHRHLQAQWQIHGKAAFALETLEVIDPDLGDYACKQALEERLAHWRATLGAKAL